MSENSRVIAINAVLIFILSFIGGIILFGLYISEWEYPSDDNANEFLNFQMELDVVFIITQFLIAMSIALFAILNYLKPNQIEVFSEQ